MSGNGHIVTWCIGHLVRLSYPEVYDAALKKWSMSTLPFMPDHYKYEVIPEVADQFKVVSQLLNDNRVSEIYNCGDSAREGQLIQDLTYMMAGVYGKKKIMRVWIDSQTDEEIKRGIAEAKPDEDYRPLFDAGRLRSIEDYMMGINYTRALSVRYGDKLKLWSGIDDKKPVTVGRVMTCVLGMVTDREREVAYFKPMPFYRVSADFEGITAFWVHTDKSRFNDHLYETTGFTDKSDAEALVNAMAGKITIANMAKKREKKAAPLLFNLAELQAECSKQFKIAPDKTLEIAQTLYEAKLTTYPRTDARVITTAVAKVIKQNISGLAKYAAVAPYVKNILDNNLYVGIEKTKYCDDKKVSDHYAIIPTGQGDASKLDKLQTDVYMLIIRRFLSIFYPQAEIDKWQVIGEAAGETYVAGVKELISPGWTEIAGMEDKTDKDKVQLLRTLKQGETYPASFAIKEGQTAPPKKYTSGSIILAMENAGSLIEDEELREQIKGSGIGTSATRAGIIKKLTLIGYIKIDKKTQTISPTLQGEVIYEITKATIPSLLSPKMTASWEKGLTLVADGSIGESEFKGKLEATVAKNTESLKRYDLSTKIAEKIPEIERRYKHGKHK
jgi:DNA topoisomerase-3